MTNSSDYRHPLTGHGQGCLCPRCDEVPVTISRTEYRLLQEAREQLDALRPGLEALAALSVRGSHLWLHRFSDDTPFLVLRDDPAGTRGEWSGPRHRGATVLDAAHELVSSLPQAHREAIKQPPDVPQGTAGWGWPSLSKKMHYFGADHRSLCLKWVYSGDRVQVLDRTHALPDQCKVCFRRRATLK